MKLNEQKPTYETHRFDGIERYNAIPKKILEEAETILDIGSSDGIGQMYSKYVDIFKSHKYTGIEVSTERVLEAREKGFNVIQGNFLDYNGPIYNVVMAHEIIAHIKESDWKPFFDKMKELTSVGGTIILTTVINQDESTYVPTGSDHWQNHVTFNINLEKIQKYFPNATEKILPSWHNFRTMGESIIWASLRWIKRIITKHEYVGKWWLPKKINAIYVIRSTQGEETSYEINAVLKNLYFGRDMK